MRGTIQASSALLALLLVSLPDSVQPGAALYAQGTPPPIPLTLISRDGRRPVPTIMVSGQELIALDDVASLFRVAVREDAAGSLAITYRGRTALMSTNQPMASVNGRVVALPSPAVMSGRRWLVPVEFLPRALAPIYDARIDLRRLSRLLIVGDLRVPRVTARIDAPGPPTRATIEITPAAPVTVATESGRIVVRIDADALDLAAPPAAAGLIGQVRLGDQPTTLVAVLDQRAGAVRAVPTETGGAARVSIEVASAAPVDSSAAPIPASESPPPAVVLTPRSVLQTIVIDPGHGGDDAGVRGQEETVEKQLTLEVARRLRALIETRLGIRVVLTRDEDRAVSLDDRAAAANNSKADLFLSLHFNGAPAPHVSGAQVYHLRLDQEGEEAGRAAETQAVPLPVLGGGSRTIEVIRWDLAQARHVDASAALSAILEDNLRTHVKMNPRPRLEVPLRVLTSVNMPAAFIELGFLTNADDVRLAKSDGHQTSLAEAIYNSIVRFRSYVEERHAR